ncbi:hypothetical protein F4820DRAFT_459241 [Hypoxylon rubiginosum]|uniref:Uncharacterized protein n=1 Tax=Hypoxylon rubiginosum TaxID=110542 RepID=A0ACB9YY56_9PEZI|nr:hypothetical protein F4820DRAFT_459241 [Hypoxylon rubiginosum]
MLDVTVVPKSPRSRASSMAKQGSEYAVSYTRQIRLVITPVFRENWRNPTYKYPKFTLCAGVVRLTNLLFSIFLLCMLFSTVDQQIIPRLIDNRALYESREGRSKSYSWIVFLSANIVMELWLPTGIWRNGDPSVDWVERGALVFVLVWLFCLWTSTFSQAIAAGIQHAEAAVQVATLSFWLSLVFCGVLVQPVALPRFWIFVYRVSPLTYFLKGMVLASFKGTHLHCSATQLLHIDPIKDRSSPLACGEYLEPYIQLAGGYVENPTATSDCRYCPVFETDRALRDILGMDTDDPWRNAAYMAVYIAFNVLATFVLYWVARVPRRKVGTSA